MDRFGYTEEMLLAGVRNEQFSDLMDSRSSRQALYMQPVAGIAMLPRRQPLAVAAAAIVYRAILDKIASAQYDVFSRRAHLPYPRN